MLLKIKNLRLQAIIGTHDWERNERQDVVINIEAEVDAARAVATDRIEDTANYRSLTKQIIEVVESSRFFLLEKLADTLLKLVMREPKILRARVEIDKPQALKYADSVSFQCSADGLLPKGFWQDRVVRGLPFDRFDEGETQQKATEVTGPDPEIVWATTRRERG